MQRKLFTLVTITSPAILALVAGFWVRSYRNAHRSILGDRIYFTHRDPLYWMDSEPGKVVLCRQKGVHVDGTDYDDFRFWSIYFQGSWSRDGGGIWNCEVPYWMLAVLASVVPTVWAAVRFWGRRRTRAGLCSSCGYDLRATPDRCPECGTLPRAGEPAAA
jgi:hypothetical protein